MTTSTNRFGELLRTQLATADMTQAELARRVDVRQQTVSKWLNGASVPRPGRIAQIAEATAAPPEVMYMAAGYTPIPFFSVGTLLRELRDGTRESIAQVANESRRNPARGSLSEYTLEMAEAGYTLLSAEDLLTVLETTANCLVLDQDVETLSEFYTLEVRDGVVESVVERHWGDSSLPEQQAHTAGASIAAKLGELPEEDREEIEALIDLKLRRHSQRAQD